MQTMSCPVTDCAKILGKKWSFEVMESIYFNQGIQFNRLLKMLKPISPKMLSERLKELEKADVLRKQSAKKNGVMTSQYFFTRQGKGLHNALRTLKKWGVKNKMIPADCIHTNCAHCNLKFKA